MELLYVHSLVSSPFPGGVFALYPAPWGPKVGGFVRRGSLHPMPYHPTPVLLQTPSCMPPTQGHCYCTRPAFLYATELH